MSQVIGMSRYLVHGWGKLGFLISSSTQASVAAVAVVSTVLHWAYILDKILHIAG